MVLSAIGRVLVVSFLALPVCFGQITNIATIRNLELDRAASGLPVEIEAQLTHLHPRKKGIFVFDGSRGIFVNLPTNASLFENLKPGAVVRLFGRTGSGDFTPNMVADKVEVVGWSPLPEPRKFHPFEIYSPDIALDCEWVSVVGRIIGTTRLDEFDCIMLELEIHGSTVGIQVPMEPDTMERVAEMMFKRVSFPAVVGTIFNRHRQMTGRVFHVNSLKDFEVSPGGGLEVDSDIRPIETLMRAGQNYQKAIHTHGLVTFAGKNTLYLRGEVTSLKVATLGLADLQPGDYVDLTGFIWPQPISPAFRAREISVVERRAPPEPVAIDAGGELNPDWNYDLVKTTATLVDMGRDVLFCRSRGRVFDVRLPEGMELDGRVVPGALLELTGICNLIPNKDPRWVYFVESLWLELRGSDDLTVLHEAPWWTPGRMAWVVGIAGLIAALFLVWVVLLRKTVARQTGIIGQQIERESMLNERQRIARELHDTLEQGLAGMALQLQSCTKQIDANLERGKEALKLAQGMLRHCRDESRNSILDLRGGLLEKMDLPSAIGKSIQPLADECGAALEVDVKGEQRRLKQFAERHLMRMAKEAATNAARHASPKRIRVELEYRPDALALRVVDDGAGFSVDQLPKSERFGLQGMRERANRIGATIEIGSDVGQGTTMRVELATKEWELDDDG